jgi:hypothetical protein
MKVLEIQVEDSGVLKLPPAISLPSQARLAVLVLGPSESVPDDLSGALISRLAQEGGAFDFLNDEPEIYSDLDILPGRENPRFRK